jgi:hypothetical protein
MDNFQEQIDQLIIRIDSLQKRLISGVNTKSRSEDLKDLFAALAKAQAEMQTAGLRSENPYFKSRYADLAEIVRVSRPALTKHGLSVIQQILPNDDGQNILHTILTHASGQWIESRMRILPSKPDVQSLASYITYLRRYSYAALCGIVASNEDDDGEVAVATDRDTFAKGVALNTSYNPREESYTTITKEQIQEAQYELDGHADIAQQVLEGLKIQSIADMPKSKFHIAMKRIREIKQARGLN